MQQCFVNAGNNFLSQNEVTAHFGLGVGALSVYHVKVTMPSGEIREFRDVPRNTTLTVRAQEPGLQ